MATISEILSEFWRGTEWRVDGDDYETLYWAAGNGIPKPSESEIRARSGEADTAIAARARLLRQQSAMNDEPDYLLKLFETLIDAVIELRRAINDVRNTIVPQAHTGDFTAWDTTVVNRIANMRQKITDRRNLP